MDKRELLFATLAGETTGSPLCGFWYHFPDDRKFGGPSVRAHKEYFEATDADILKVMNEYRYVLDREINSTRDWRNVRQKKFEDTPYVGFTEEFRAIRKEIPSGVPMIATVHGVFVSAFHASEKSGNFSNPDNKVSSHMREDPETVYTGLQTIAETIVELAVRLKQAGADGIYYAALGGERYRFSQEILEKYIIPLDSYVINSIHNLGLLSVLHICKDKVRLPSYGSLNADIVNWAVHECEYSLSDGRTIFPGRTLLGGFDDRSGILVEGTEDQIMAEAKKILSEAGRKKFIFGADCTLPENIELWRINLVHSCAAAM